MMRGEIEGGCSPKPRKSSIESIQCRVLYLVWSWNFACSALKILKEGRQESTLESRTAALAPGREEALGWALVNLQSQQNESMRLVENEAGSGGASVCRGESWQVHSGPKLITWLRGWHGPERKTKTP